MMKKAIFSFAIAAVAALMVACGGNKTDNNAGEAKQEAYTFSVQNNITGTTGTANCHIPDLGAPMSFEVAGEGDILDVTATVKVTHRDKSELADEPRATTELWIRGRQDDNKDTQITLTADEEMQKQIIEWLSQPAGTDLNIVFKGKVPKADLDKLNAKECTNTLVL